MKYMTTAEIREKFIRYFEDKKCKHFASSSLIPDDPSLLLTSAGMVQFKPYFLQQKKLDDKYVGAVSVQKCVRTNDIDIIGTTGRHLSFFEMLGNFSFGKYFKHEMCKWALDFSVNVMEMPMDRLYFTVYKDDDETIDIWKDLGVDPSHISKLGDEDNFWRAGPTGPCGPCSELHYDQGPEFGCGKPDCAPGCDCDRYLEFWNLVFTQYDGQEDGSLEPLPKKNIDTGMGLERMAAIMQGVSSNYETDVLRSLIGVGERLFGCVYGKDAATDLSLRIIADHSRAVTFMIADGILPGNEGREYVLRRLLRRCVMKAFLLGVEEPFLEKYIDEIVNLMGDVYKEVIDNLPLIKRVVLSEEERFGATIKKGIEIVNDALNTRKDTDLIDGEEAFLLHDTYGFPIELTVELCEERGVKVDMEGFKRCMQEQRDRARSANTDDSEAAWSTYGGPAAEILKEHGPTQFVGYDQMITAAKIIGIVKDGQLVDSVSAGDECQIYTDVTSFYGEMGGQVGDIGMIASSENQTSALEATDVTAANCAKVTDTIHPEKGLTAHVAKVTEGSFKVGDNVMCRVDVLTRARTCRNHTATHILHWALRKVLGDHVNQAGSYVAPDRLRFDFTHFEGMTHDQVEEVEVLANKKVMMANNVGTYNTSLDQARKSGVTALFGEKYGDEVRVVNVGDFSKELCGGCHVNNTAEIGFIKILNESSVGSNARRIEAVTSFDAYAYSNDMIEALNNSATMLKTQPKNLPHAVERNLDKIKDLNQKLKVAMSKSGTDMFEDALDEVFENSAGYKVFVKKIAYPQGRDIKEIWDICKDHIGDNVAAVLAIENNDKAILLAAGTDKAVAAGFNANDVIKSISGHIKGGGGGKPSMAQAGGKDPAGIEAALDAAREMLQ